MQIKKAHALHGEINIPGDKSISHRAIMFGSLSNGTTEITNFLEGADCLSTISCFQEMGIKIEQKKKLCTCPWKRITRSKGATAYLRRGEQWNYYPADFWYLSR